VEEFICADGKPIWMGLRCDGVEDCSAGDDESGCVTDAP
jgi:hypothetical protein